MTDVEGTGVVRLPAIVALCLVLAAPAAGSPQRGADGPPRALQTLQLKREQVEGVDVWTRSFSTRRPGQSEVLAEGMIHMDARTLAPMWSRSVRAGSIVETEYDWEGFVVRQTTESGDDRSSNEEPLDLQMLEAAAHDVWMGVMPRDRRARMPAILAGGGGKYWIVPRLVRSEPFDLGDGVARDAWVIELDWWGMGKDRASFYPGGGAKGTAGTGGTYWVLKSPPAGVPPLVRIRTEVDDSTDRVTQMQDGAASLP